ncbi:hypothetical protein ACH4N4_30190 [Streptomyces microflavus]|uniref:hypothetical protein n=1 Tax=Streptomyces microflavus TaxID=1919 RepID=UPI0037A50A7C
MGLDLCAGREAGRLPDDPWPQWSYGGFSLFRSKLAATIGVDLDRMKGFGGEGDWSSVESPLRHLLDHADNEGELSPQQAAELAPALEQALFQLARSGAYGHTWDYDRRAGRELVDLLARCASENVPVLFR